MQDYQYTEDHYAEMYSNLPEGLKDLVINGRLAILVSAIGSRHGLTADQIADLEPAIEDVCLGLITKTELAANIKKQVGVDDRVSNRIAAEAEIEILRPFEPELLIARQQKEDLDAKIAKQAGTKPQVKTTTSSGKVANQVAEPQDVSEHTNVKAIKSFFGGEETTTQTEQPKEALPKGEFDWEQSLGKATSTPSLEVKNIETERTGAPIVAAQNPNPEPATGVEAKLDKLTESINKLVGERFGTSPKDSEVSIQMQELLKRLEKAEKENEENKKLIKKLSGESGNSSTLDIFNTAGTKTENKIQIDKERKVEIKKDGDKKESSGNVVVSTTIQNPIPVVKTPTSELHTFSSTVSEDTLGAIVETKQKETLNESKLSSKSQPEKTKQSLTLDELLSKNDEKISEATKKVETKTLVFPGINDDKKVDIQNIEHKGAIKDTLAADLEFLKKRKAGESDKTKKDGQDLAQMKMSQSASGGINSSTDIVNSTQKSDDSLKDVAATAAATSTPENPFQDEILPKTKEDRMKALQDKIKSMNKGVSVGGKTNISTANLDPYKV